MTREHKLALIVGFSLFLVLGVLVSDHFSKSRQVELAENIQPSSPRQMGAEEARGLRGNAAGTVSPLPSTTPVVGRTDLVPLPGSPKPAPGTIAGPQLAMGGTRSPMSPLVDVNGNGNIYPPHLSTDETLHQGNGTPAPLVAQPQIPVQKHEVKEGDTLYRIAVKYYGEGKLWEKIRDYNKFGSESLREGATVNIPPKDVLLGKPYTPPPSSEMVRLGGGADPRGGSAGKPDAIKPTGETAGREYIVKSGDTLVGIARKMLSSDRRSSEIIDLNKDTLSDPDALKVGMKLRIPAK